MINISHKITTLRTAKARAIVEMAPETVQRILSREVPKGDVLEFIKAAAMVGAKKTPELLLFCHNIPIEWVRTETEIEDGKRIIIDVTVQSTAKTGCEMEALTAASAAALTVYDMCKPIDKDMEILSVKLLKKTGGKSQFKEKVSEGMKAGVLVISDSVSAGKKQDTAGKNILHKLEEVGIDGAEYKIVPDESE
ncbi:MAG: cyclic pyranopterin monophosphate synthase MoaC, partial [Deltaproteobacteria bacterium]|nr:cyclic pyranopterin monophosphate synthase MoaC [Deltaproteobacteria bacterium]